MRRTLPYTFLSVAVLAACTQATDAPAPQDTVAAPEAAAPATAPAVSSPETETAVLIPASTTADMPEPDAPAPRAEPNTPDTSFHDPLNRLDEAKWYVADGWGIPAAWVDTLWLRSAIRRVDGGLSFTATDIEDDTKGYGGASIERRGRVHYGRYETIMTAAKGDGLVSAFFMYTGPHFGTDQHEIDFEFLGKDTTQVQLNYYVRGDGGNEVMIDLGYDALTTPNLYAFEWRPDSLKWFIGDRLVHQVNGTSHSLPSVAGMVFAQLWTGGPSTENWLGSPVSLDDPVMTVDCISFRPLDRLGLDTGTPMCADGFEPINTATPSSAAQGN